MTSIKNALAGLWSLVVGMGITGKYFTAPLVTVFYPRQEAENIETYRGHVELVGKEDEAGVPLCIACGQCARQCPSQCITVSAKVAPADPAESKDGKPAKPKRLKTPGVFQLDYNLCSLCGQCVQVCPVDSLRYSNNVYFAVFTRQETNIDLLERLERQAKEGK
ncbi:MAG: NADH-quinone oxidoreductase subunit [Desulfovibrionales bacterium]|nr:NADH-quinone oxidoreductase subunit [Desulfovibrionales bacterium]